MRFNIPVEKFEYNYDDASGILYKSYFGPVTLEDITSSWEHALRHKLIPPGTKRFIVDFRQAAMNLEIDEHQGIVDFYRNHLEVFGEARVAVLVENPRDMVLPVLVNTKDEGYHSRPFTTLEGALRWLRS